MGYEMADECPFCDPDKIKSEVARMFAADGSEHFVFEPLRPVTPGHLLVVPTVHVESATEDPLVTAMSAGVAARVASLCRSANLITSIGVPATQSVFHLHWHVVPREMGDNLMLPWTQRGET